MLYYITQLKPYDESTIPITTYYKRKLLNSYYKFATNCELCIYAIIKRVIKTVLT